MKKLLALLAVLAFGTQVSFAGENRTENSSGITRRRVRNDFCQRTACTQKFPGFNNRMSREIVDGKCKNCNQAPE